MSCEYCNGKETLYQHTHNTMLYINTFGKARTLVTICDPCPPNANCCMKSIPARSAFQINYCPNCGTPLAEQKALTLDELRERDGKPVWIERLSPYVDLDYSGWASVDGPIVLARRDGVPISWSCRVWWFGNVVEGNPNVEDYGKTWLAYDREPKKEEVDG